LFIATGCVGAGISVAGGIGLGLALLAAGKENPFDFQGQGLKNYIINVTAARDRYNYYQIDKDVNKLFTDPNNPDRNRATYRREILANADAQKKVLLSGNWALKEALVQKAFEQRQSQITKFTALESMVRDKDFIDKLPKEHVKTLQLMTSLSRRLLNVFEDTNIRTQFNGTETLDKEKIQGMANLENLSKGNRALTDAYESIIRPLLDEVYTTPTKVMEK
jgi:phosphopantetheinyl transferase (holo-ACP synthase)